MGKKSVILEMQPINLKNMFYSYLYTAGRLAGLLEDVAKDSTVKKDDISLIFPFLYLLRHTIEMLLKITILHIDPSYNIPMAANKSHNLDYLYDVLCNLDKNLKIEVDQYKQVITFFDDDKDGSLYKYTMDKSKNPRKKYGAPLKVNITGLTNNAQLFFDKFSDYIKKTYPGLIN